MSRANTSRNPITRLRTAVYGHRERRAALYEYDQLSAEAGAHDPHFLTAKPHVLGSFIVEPYRISADMPELGLSPADPYLDVSLPPLDSEMLSREELVRSHNLLARHVAVNGLARTKMTGIGGLTSRKMASMVKRVLGFEYTEVDATTMPEYGLRSAERIYNSFVGGREDFVPVFVHQTTEALLERHAHDPEVASYIENPVDPPFDTIPELDYYANGVR
jgi:hypothetical protein